MKSVPKGFASLLNNRQRLKRLAASSLKSFQDNCKSYAMVFLVGFNRLELLGGGFNRRRLLLNSSNHPILLTRNILQRLQLFYHP
jgi:hypothetical protein